MVIKMTPSEQCKKAGLKIRTQGVELSGFPRQTFINELRAQADAMSPPYSPEDLRVIRESFGMRPAEFARLLRIDRSTWHKWEQGQTAPAVAHSAIAMLLLMRRHNKGSLILMEWIDGC